MSVFRILRPLWHIIPDSVRGPLARSGPVRGIKRVLKPNQADLHNLTYDRAYYEGVDQSTSKSAPPMITSIMRDLSPSSVLDIGCGTGALLMEFRKHGLEGDGLEYSDAALKMCHNRKLNVRKFDLETDTLSPPAKPYGLVMSTEVAEHLPEHLADPFVDAICSQGKTVVFTAATPGQGGTDHVNEQPHQYWIDKFQKRGFIFDHTTSQRWRAEWKEAKIAFWYFQNVMVFRA